MEIGLRVNGLDVRLDADADTLLLFVLRDRLGLTGAKPGCGEGECGACTVVVGGQAVRSCITPLASVEGKDVLTIEGLEQGGRLHPLQQAFLDEGAFQCGYCTPGMIMSAYAFLATCPNPSNNDVVAALNGNICRCGTYNRIVRAVKRAAADLQQGEQAHEQGHEQEREQEREQEGER
jgi:aerobic-type carbon monoxide dehydrogenase small subunit (CoxS/CutS family)